MKSGTSIFWIILLVLVLFVFTPIVKNIAEDWYPYYERIMEIIDENTKIEPEVEETRIEELSLSDIDKKVTIRAYNDKAKEILNLDLEEYVLGVVAAEMPIGFRDEALKAQTILARTYALNKMQASLASNYDITLSYKTDQAYTDPADLKKQWGTNYEKNYERLKEIVDGTKGLVVTYNGEPITAFYHSTSSGYTQGSEDVWQKGFPYLVSVASTLDTRSPNYSETKAYKKDEFLNLMKSKLKVEIPDKETFFNNIKILERNQAGYVLRFSIAGKTISGNDFRNMLALRSSDFEIQIGQDVKISTKGFGHGVGMSQYGANFMAEEGKSYDQIIKHYYTGVEIEKM